MLQAYSFFYQHTHTNVEIVSRLLDEERFNKVHLNNSI